jgi:hypothetical protein
MHACKIATLQTGYLKIVLEVFFLPRDFNMWIHFNPFVHHLILSTQNSYSGTITSCSFI